MRRRRRRKKKRRKRKRAKKQRMMKHRFALDGSAAAVSLLGVPKAQWPKGRREGQER